MTPTTLTKLELEEVLKRVVTFNVEQGSVRIIKRLANQIGVATVDVNRDCAVGNISDIVIKQINPRVFPMGLYVGCTRPPKAIKNRFGQETGMHLWSFYRMPDAANDPIYSQSEDK